MKIIKILVVQFSFNIIEEYINKLKDLVDDDNKIDEVIKENYYEWEIEDWNKLGYRAIKEFSAVGCTW